ncbi:hypothetical protein L4C34_07495 [Vibrio profundum]|uniref:hypothetical protein n=1 Tax=Vibrio profundum TaxID=2910247 RepID=UPI003D14C111
MEKFEDLPLHDAVVKDFCFLWEQSVVEIHLSVFKTFKERAKPHLLKFYDVRELYCPQKCDWGMSAHVNSNEFKDGLYMIQMQSGDVVQVTAGHFELTEIL